jgi:hypothetical protein
MYSDTLKITTCTFNMSGRRGSDPGTLKEAVLPMNISIIIENLVGGTGSFRVPEYRFKTYPYFLA